MGGRVILIKGLTPIPFSRHHRQRLRQFNFGLFVLLAAITRGARFFLIACCSTLRIAHPEFHRRRLTLISWRCSADRRRCFALVALI